VRRYIRGAFLACCVGTVVFECCWCFAQPEQIEAPRKLVKNSAPIYPELARLMRISGSVKVKVVVAPNGFPKDSKALGGHPLLVEAAIKAIHKWRWVRSTHETTETIEITFNPN
jgi:TonB family protein